MHETKRSQPHVVEPNSRNKPATHCLETGSTSSTSMRNQVYFVAKNFKFLKGKFDAKSKYRFFILPVEVRGSFNVVTQKANSSDLTVSGKRRCL